MVLADCCMHQQWVGGANVAVGRRWPPWLKWVFGKHFALTKMRAKHPFSIMAAAAIQRSPQFL
jgi:hypothetical protein